MFEILFKYPASIFHKGHFVLLTPWPLWLLAIGILAAAGLLFWHIRRHHGMLSGARPTAVVLDGRPVDNYQVLQTNRGTEVTMSTTAGHHTLTITA